MRSEVGWEEALAILKISGTSVAVFLVWDSRRCVTEQFTVVEGRSCPGASELRLAREGFGCRVCRHDGLLILDDGKERPN